LYTKEQDMQTAAVTKPATIEYWRNLARTSTHGLGAEDLEAIATICLDTQQAGNPVGVWHASAMHFNRLDRCNCTPCTQARGEPLGRWKI
jgi:hypothetical protein